MNLHQWSSNSLEFMELLPEGEESSLNAVKPMLPHHHLGKL